MFNEAITESSTLSFESWTTERKPFNTGRELQHDIGSSSKIKSPLYLKAAHQKTERIDAADPARNLSKNRLSNAIFDIVTVINYFAEIDGIRCPKYPFKNNYTENNHLNQFRDPKVFYKVYVGEPLLSPTKSYDNLKKNYPIKVTDLRFQVDYVPPEKIGLFEESNEKPTNTNLYVILIKHGESRLVFDGNKTSGFEPFGKTILGLRDFVKNSNLKDDTMTESQRKEVYIFQIYPKHSKTTTNKAFVNIDSGSIGGTHWTCFYVKYNKSYYFDSFGGSPDKFILQLLPKPITFHN